MSTPPFVDLPRGVEAISFPGGYGPLAGLLATPPGPSRGAILLIPGFTGSKEDFIALMPLLRDLGYVVARYDHRGQYQSCGPAELADYRMEEFVADAVRVIENLAATSGSPIHLVGHSFGGLVARGAAVHALVGPSSERNSDVFSSLTLLASGPGAVPAEMREMAQQFIDAMGVMSLREIWDHQEATDRAAGWIPPSDDVLAFLRGRFLANNPVALAAKAQILIDVNDTVDQLAAAVSTADLPTLVAYGELDNRWPPAEQLEMAGRLGARRFLFPGAGHSPNAEIPHWCAAALEGFFADSVNISALPVAFADLHQGYNDGMELLAPVQSTPEAAGEARRMLARQLVAWGLEDAVDDLELLASELVTNAIRYGKTPVAVRLISRGSTLRLEVTDGNSRDVPTPRVALDTESNGRGLSLVDAVATTWGVSIESSGKTVWAELTIAPTRN
ncbi:MAG: alpha/beta fold hydrolase [Actinobacteria bacterium]|nr:alpha/beta fold hydrolase [Actinomycetota bacterium]